MHTVLFLSHLLLYTWSANKFHQANQINHAGINTLFIIRTDSHKIIYPVYLYLQNCQQFVLTLDFLLVHLHICFLMEELFSVHAMSLCAYIMQALRDNNLVTRAFKSDYGCAKIAVQQCGVRVTTPQSIFAWCFITPFSFEEILLKNAVGSSFFYPFSSHYLAKKISQNFLKCCKSNTMLPCSLC